MTERSDSSPRRLSAVTAAPGMIGAPVSPPTPQYPRLGSTPTYAAIPPHPVLPHDGFIGAQHLLPVPYHHYAMAPCIGAWPPPGQYMAPVQYPVSRRSYSLSPQPLSALPPGDYEHKRAPAELTRSTGASSRRKSAQRRDKPYMLQRCGPFYAWQLIIMWFAVLGTVVFVCSFGAFRQYLTQEPPVDGMARARERALTSTPVPKNRHPPVYVNTSCGIHHPCRGVGLLCIGGQCTCGPDFEEHGELCSPRKNVAVEIRIGSPTAQPPRTRKSSSGNRSTPEPRKGVHKRNALSKKLVQPRVKATEEEFTFVFATFEYEDHGHRHIVAGEGTRMTPREATHRLSWQRHAKDHRRKKSQSTTK
ncbi:uncharacterized protein LOC144129964 [Amblyomma americanum]